VDDAFPYPEAFAWSNPGEDFYKAMREEAKKELGDLLKEHPAGPVTVERVILQGKPYEEILSLAGDKGVGLIVLSTHSRSGLDHVLMGSQAEKILRRARCPVLVVKPPRE
jgi:nucleotide-binding universal stress UspA family protein